MRAFQGTTTKAELLAKLQAREAVELRSYQDYEVCLGIPESLMRLEVTIFGGLPSRRSKTWLVRFIQAIPVGADLSRVAWRFLHWFVTDDLLFPGARHPAACTAVSQCADILVQRVEGCEPDRKFAEETARMARRAMEAAEWEMRRATNATEWSASRSASLAAQSAANAVEALWSPEWSLSSALNVVQRVETAAAMDRAFCSMADKLIELLKEAS